MAQKQMGRRRANGIALTHVKPLRSDASEYITASDLCQVSFDVVGLLAARARVAMPTARLHAELFGIGGTR